MTYTLLVQGDDFTDSLSFIQFATHLRCQVPTSWRPV